MAFVVKQPKKKGPPKGSLRFFLHEELVSTQKARSYKTVHASDLMSQTEFCPREYALGLKHFTPRPDERVATAQRVVWDYGRKVEDIVRDYFIRMSRCWGDWECRLCNHMHLFQRAPAKCSKCSADRMFLAYNEVRFTSAVSGVSGGVDMILNIDGPKFVLVEIKSMDKEEFKKLAAPLAEHRWRTNLYMRLVEESEHPQKDKINVQEARVLYVTKGGYGYKDPDIRHWGLLDGDFSPFKEYIVHRDDTATEDRCAKGRMVEEFKKTGELPLGICPTSLAQRAKFCPQADKCFGG